MKRSGKFYRKNEAEVMKALGLNPTPNSGSGWIVKEDGQNEHILCQLKSTDANSIRINKLDVDKLEYNALVAHKLPVFAIQFIKDNQVYLLMKPELLNDISRYIETGIAEVPQALLDVSNEKADKNITLKNGPIRSALRAREKYTKEIEKRYVKKEKSAL